jgi:hypothetical protein
MGIRTLSMWLYLLLTVPIIGYLLLDRRPAIESTNFHFSPDVIRPGQKSDAVWTTKTLRDPDRCRGLVHRKFIDSNGQEFPFAPIDATIHDPVGDTATHRFRWRIPEGMAPGPAIFRRNVDRWCNPLQQWFWPMYEQHEATFTVAE